MRRGDKWPWRRAPGRRERDESVVLQSPFYQYEEDRSDIGPPIVTNQADTVFWSEGMAVQSQDLTNDAFDNLFQSFGVGIGMDSQPPQQQISDIKGGVHPSSQTSERPFYPTEVRGTVSNKAVNRSRVNLPEIKVPVHDHNSKHHFDQRKQEESITMQMVNSPTSSVSTVASGEEAGRKYQDHSSKRKSDFQSLKSTSKKQQKRQKRPYFRRSKYPKEVVEEFEARKKIEKRERNRILAAQSRQRQKEEVASLKKENSDLKRENDKLKSSSISLKEQLAAVIERLKFYEDMRFNPQKPFL